MLVLPFPVRINNYYSCLYLSHLGFCALLVVLKTTYPHTHSAVDKMTMKLFYGNKLCSVSPLFHPSPCKVSDTNISQCLSGPWLLASVCNSVVVGGLLSQYLHQVSMKHNFCLSGDFVIWLNINPADVIVHCCDIWIKQEKPKTLCTLGRAFPVIHCFTNLIERVAVLLCWPCLPNTVAGGVDVCLRWICRHSRRASVNNSYLGVAATQNCWAHTVNCD